MLKRLKNVRIRDWILIMGIMLAPMTGLRIGKVGPAEFLCLIWCLPVLKDLFVSDLREYKFKFWILFIYVTFLGTLYGLAFYPNETSTFGIVTYVYLGLIFLCICKGLSKKSYEEVNNIFAVLCVVIALWYIFLYFYSNVSNSFFGAPLWYGNHYRYSGGGTNPHQLAVCMGAAIFGNARSFLRTKGICIEKFIYAACVLICLFIAGETESSTLVASIAITTFLGVFLYVFSKIDNKQKKTAFIIVTVLLCVAVFIIFYDAIYNVFMNWLADDENGMGRLEIFKTLPYTLKKNPIIGLGPGIHAFDGVFEYHNTYLEIIAMSGFVGFFIFVLFSIRLFKKLGNETMLMLCIIPLYSYGLAGFAMRRLIYWSVLAIVITLAEKSGIIRNDMKGITNV